MIVCHEVERELWTPDFSSAGLANPRWTRLRVRGREVSNAVEWVSWRENPVQVILCDACGTIGCAAGGCIHLSRLEDLVLWSCPQLDPAVPYEPGEFAPVIAFEFLGAIGFPAGVWDSLAAAFPELPASREVPAANWRAVADAWLLGPGRPQTLAELPAFLGKELLACETLGNPEAIAWIDRWCKWFEEHATETATPLRKRDSVRGKGEMLCFHSPGAEDWTAFVRVGEEYFPAIGDGYFVDRDVV